MMFRRWIFMVILASHAVVVAAAEPRYVQSKKADLLAQPQFGAPVVVTVQQGAELSFVEQRGTWVSVQSPNGAGWVSKLLIGPNPPMKKISALEQVDDSLTTSARRRASDVTAAGATRGLTAEDRRRASQEDAADFDALSRLEQWSVDDTEVEKFMRDVRGLP